MFIKYKNIKQIIKKLLNLFNLDVIPINRRNSGITYELLSNNYNLLQSKYSDLEGRHIEAIIELFALYKKNYLPNLPINTDSLNIRYKLFTKLLGTNIIEAIYLINYLHKTLKLKGDICEFGVAQGATSVLIANEISNIQKKIWLFDSFKGLPKPTEKDKLKNDIFNLGSMDAYEGQMSFDKTSVLNKLKKINFDFKRLNIVSGFIEDTINDNNLPNKVCFAYIDFDLYEPILIALNFLNKSLSINGYIIVDDYDFFSTGAKSAVDEFISINKESYKFLLPDESKGKFCIIKKIR